MRDIDEIPPMRSSGSQRRSRDVGCAAHEKLTAQLGRAGKRPRRVCCERYSKEPEGKKTVSARYRNHRLREVLPPAAANAGVGANTTREISWWPSDASATRRA